MRIATFTLPEDVERERQLTVHSEPGLAGGRVVLGALALVFWLVAAAGVVLMVEGRAGPVAILFGMLLIGMSLGAVYLLWRHWRRAPVPWVRVSPEGLHSDHVPGLPQELLWRDVGGDAAATLCVNWARERESTQRQIKVPLRTGGQVLLSLALPNTMKCLRFRNARALRRAVLLHLAAVDRPRLRFDPEVFVGAQLSPRTWAPMRKPAWLQALLLGALLLAGCYVIFLRFDTSAVWWSVGAFLGMAIAAAAVVSWAQWLHFPDLRDTIEFDSP